MSLLELPYELIEIIIEFACTEEHVLNLSYFRSIKINTINCDLLKELSLVCNVIHLITTRMMENKKYVMKIKYDNSMKSKKMRLSLIKKYVTTVPKNITDDKLKYLKGAHTIDLFCCRNITDNGLEYLKGVHSASKRSTYNIFI